MAVRLMVFRDAAIGGLALLAERAVPSQTRRSRQPLRAPHFVDILLTLVHAGRSINQDPLKERLDGRANEAPWETSTIDFAQ